MRTVAEALVELDSQMERLDHPICRYKEAPASDDQILAGFQSIGIYELPADLLSLWGWQSSTYGPWRQARMTIPGSTVLPGWLSLLPLDEVLEQYDLHGLYGTASVNESYIPALGSKDFLAWVDSSNSQESATRTVVLDRVSPDPYLVFPSLVDLIDTMTMMLSKGYWAYYDHGVDEFWWSFTPLFDADGFDWI